MNWQAVWNKAKYAIVPLACLVAIIIVYNYATGRPAEEKAAHAKKKTEPARLDRMDPSAAEIHIGAINASLSGIDKEVARKARIQSGQDLRQLETGQLSLDDARMSTMGLARNMLVQNRFRAEIDDVVRKADKPIPDKDWLDRILDINPRKFLFVIVIVLVAVLLTGAILGKSEIRKVAWSIAIILIAFLVVNQFWKSGGSIFAQENSTSVSTKHKQHQTILQTGPNSWTLVDQLPSRTDFTIDYPGDWLEYKLLDGRRVKHENTTGKKYLTDPKGNVLGPPPSFPNRTFYIRTEKMGPTTITW